MSEYLFTSETVTEGHPDKLCDQVSDAVLDAVLKEDPYGRVACETLAKTGFVMVAGEITTSAMLDFPKIVREVVKDIGYNDTDVGFDYKTCGVMVGGRAAVARHRAGRGRQGRLHQGRPGRRRPGHDVRLRLRRDDGADAAADHARAPAGQAAGGRAQEGPGRLPAPRRQDPGHGALRRRTTSRSPSTRWCVSTQHTESVKYKTLRDAIMDEVIKPILPAELRQHEDQVLHQPDRPLRGRRPHGRLGPHRPQDHRRHLRRHGPSRRRRLLGQGSVEGGSLGLLLRALHRQEHRGRRAWRARCEVQLAYAIGVAEPVSLLVETFGTGTVPEDKIVGSS